MQNPPTTDAQRAAVIAALGPAPTCQCGQPLCVTRKIEKDYDSWGGQKDHECTDYDIYCADSDCELPIITEDDPYEYLCAAEQVRERLKHETMRGVVLSTCHVTQEEAQRKDSEWPTRCVSDEYGMFVHVYQESETGESFTSVLGRDSYGEWKGLVRCMEWARTNGFRWIQFDRDADVIEDLHSYDW